MARAKRPPQPPEVDEDFERECVERLARFYRAFGYEVDEGALAERLRGMAEREGL